MTEIKDIDSSQFDEEDRELIRENSRNIAAIIMFLLLLVSILIVAALIAFR